MNKIEIRKANINDSEPIAVVLVESWRHAYKGIMPDEVLDNLSVSKRSEGWSTHLSDGGEAYVLIESEKIIGVLEVSRFRGELKEYEHYAEIPVIYLLPKKIGKGFGFLLMEYAQQLLASKGFNDIAIWVLEKNTRAIQFYNKAGFLFSGVVKEHLSTGLTERLYTKNA